LETQPARQNYQHIRNQKTERREERGGRSEDIDKIGANRGEEKREDKREEKRREKG